MKAIGGYFELQLAKGPFQFHKDVPAFQSGRAALSYILNRVRPVLVHIPFYTCDALLDPFRSAGIQYKFYNTDDFLEPATLPELKENEFFLYINYFDIKRETTYRLSERYADRLIVDNTQAFFMKGNGRSWFFNSCRKFFGVPDGSYLYAPNAIEVPVPETQNESYTVDHLVKRFNGHTREGYASFQENEILCGQGMSGMSRLGEFLLSHVDYEESILRRRRNFRFLEDFLGRYNTSRPSPGEDAVPMVYPLLLRSPVDRSKLYEKDIFIPLFWNEVRLREHKGYEAESSYSLRLLPLPIDHRYDPADLYRMAGRVKELIN